MRLLIHAGTEKTGSSFLQTFFRSASDELVEAGIHFPAEQVQEGGKFGGVSSDGAHLAELVRHRDSVGVVDLLTRYRRRAESLGCDSVLISYSGFWVHLLEIGEQLFVEQARAAGFQTFVGLMFVRDPVSHAMSHYFQVVKVGWTQQRFDRWVVDHYQGLDGIADLLATSAVVKWTIRRYDPTIRPLEGVVFEDWLGLPVGTGRGDGAQVEPGRRVNRSLTAEEALCIVEMAGDVPGIHEALAPRFLALDDVHRPQAGPGDSWCRSVANRHARNLSSAIDAVNEALPRDERFSLVLGESGEEPTRPIGFNLTDEQHKVVELGKAAHLAEFGTRWRRYGPWTRSKKWIYELTPMPVRRFYRWVLRPLRRVRRRLG